MQQVTIYTAPLCPYCRLAKELLRRKGAAVQEYDVAGQPGLRAEMTERSGGRLTVPQIWVGRRHVGGYDDLRELDRAGRLDALLGADV